MDIQSWTYIIVGCTFVLYVVLAIISRATTTDDFYVAGMEISPLANGMATAADWMSAASFISMAGLISFMGRDGSVYLMGWTGGYVLLALLLAPYLRKFGKYTVPDFVGERYYSQTARQVAVLCAIFVSFTYVAGQMRGVGVVFSRFLEVDINTGVLIGMGIVFFYAVLGGMKGITYTQVAQYCVLIFAYLVPAIFISLLLTGHVFPQIGFGSELKGEEGVYLLDRLDVISTDLGFGKYTEGTKSKIDVFFITASLMIGTAGLPHVIIRFFTVPKVKAARLSVGYALFFIALLYTTAPAIAAFTKTNLITTIHNTSYQNAPSWFKTWENTGLIAWVDKNQDGKIQYAKGKPFIGTPNFSKNPNNRDKLGESGERLITNKITTDNPNELYIDNDIMVLANPEIAKLPAWVIALVAAGALAAALSTAAGLLLVISTSISHDFLKKMVMPNITEKQELFFARVAASGAVTVAGFFGMHPPGFVAQVVAFAFGLAASSFFPAIILGIFSKRLNKEGAIAGMLSGVVFTSAYIVYFKFVEPTANTAENWWFGISPEGIGALGMLVNLAIALLVSTFTPPPPVSVQEMVESIRLPED
ncbi:MAG: cation acetate symporter [Leptospiraceae bacterium]|nr:cation acetate symporter [Leptospiraceae bacterium]MCP5495622.1 cation acetate symporter [Leptospiraceae bacterium]